MFISKAHLLEVFSIKLVFNLKSEASKTYLSYVWWLLELTNIHFQKLQQELEIYYREYQEFPVPMSRINC